MKKVKLSYQVAYLIGLFLIPISLSSCNKINGPSNSKTSAAQPVDTTLPDAVAPVAPTVSSEGYAGVSKDYSSVRSELLRLGLTIAPDKPELPNDQFSELDCDAGGTECRALFLETDSQGWRRYVIVSTSGSPPVVSSISRAVTSDGLPAIPPPEASDIPKLSASYWDARAELIGLGYRPAKAAEEPYKVCAQEMVSGDSQDCEPDTELPEIESCSGTGMGFCIAYWIAPDDRVLSITTAGEPQPGRIYHKEWKDESEAQ